MKVGLDGGILRQQGHTESAFPFCIWVYPDCGGVIVLIQLTLNWQVDAQPLNPCANVFHYKSFLAVTDELHTFTDAWIAQHFPAIADVCAAQGTFLNAVAIDLADPAGEWTHIFAPDTHGAQPGEILPLWVTASFEYRRKVRGDRSGRKGFGPVAEGVSINGDPSAGYRTACDASAATLSTPITVGLIDTWFPVIGVRPVPPSTTWSSHDVQAVIFKRFGSQNTRKR
jgi:hypothetical protein